MTPLRPATFCLVITGDSPAGGAPCLQALLEAALSGSFVLHLGFSQAPLSRRYVLGRLCPDGHFPTRAVLPGGVKRFSWTSAQGTTVHAWNSDRRLPEQELATWLWTDVPLTTDYVVWFDAGCCLETGWDEAQLHLPAQGSDYFGRSTWIDYSSQDAERLQGRPWYRGVPLERRNGRPGLSFLNRLWGLRTACLREVEGSGERNWNRWAKEQSGGWPVLMGEIARQLNWSRTVYDPYSQGTTDAVPSTNGVQPAIPNRGLNPQRLENR